MAFSRWTIVLAIMSVFLTIIAIAVTGFFADWLAKVTSSTGGMVSEIIGGIIGAVVIFMISYLYSKREIKRKKSNKNRLRQKEKDFFSKIKGDSQF